MSKPELWLGEPVGTTSGSTQTHEIWVKTLVKALLSTGVVKDELLCKIGPLCALKVTYLFCKRSAGLETVAKSKRKTKVMSNSDILGYLMFKENYSS